MKKFEVEMEFTYTGTFTLKAANSEKARAKLMKNSNLELTSDLLRAKLDSKGVDWEFEVQPRKTTKSINGVTALSAVPINASQGLLVDSQCRAYGIYSHHSRRIALKAPWTFRDVELPPGMGDYRRLLTTGLSVSYWRNDRDHYGNDEI